MPGMKLYRCKTPTDRLCPCGKVARELKSAGVEFETERAPLSLFIAGQIAESNALEQSVIRDLRKIFPGAAEHTVASALDRVEASSTSIGIAALITSIWIGASFWGALDTAFCRIYHFRCRTWLEQKRFSLAMLVVVLLFMAATVAVPTIQSLLLSGARDLPFGLSTVHSLVYVLSLLAAGLVLFAILCVVYWAVPNRPVPWRAVWPGAASATV